MCCAVTALEAAEVLQSVMETAAMVAPPCQLRMHIRDLPQPPAADGYGAVPESMADSQLSARYFHGGNEVLSCQTFMRFRARAVIGSSHRVHGSACNPVHYPTLPQMPTHVWR